MFFTIATLWIVTIILLSLFKWQSPSLSSVNFFYMMHHSYPETFFSVYLSSFPKSLCVICLECIVLAGEKILIYINTGTITEIFFSLTER